MLIKKLQAMKAKKGFTLVELIVVVAIIGILAAILIPILMGYIAGSRVSAANSTTSTIHTTLSNWIADMEAKGITLQVAGGAFNCTGGTWTPPAINHVSGPVIPATDTLLLRLQAECVGLTGHGAVWANAAGNGVEAVAWQPNAAAAIPAGIGYTPGAANGGWAGFDQTAKRTNTTANGIVVGTKPAHSL